MTGISRARWHHLTPLLGAGLLFAVTISLAVTTSAEQRPAKSSTYYGGTVPAKTDPSLGHLVTQLRKRYARLRFDGRYDVAAKHLAANWPASTDQAQPSATLLGRVLEHFGIGRPAPYVLVAECKSEVAAGASQIESRCAEDALLTKVPVLLAQPDLRQAVDSGSNLIGGVGVAHVHVRTDGEAALRIVLLISPERVRLDRVARELPPGNVTLRGTVPASALALRAVVSVPLSPATSAGVTKLETRELPVEVSPPQAADGGATNRVSKRRSKQPRKSAGQVAFVVTFSCGGWPQGGWSTGMYEVELLGSGRQGPHILFNLPLYCGVAAPELQALADLENQPRPHAPNGRAHGNRQSAVELARALFNLSVAARNRESAPALAWDDALAKVATAHAQDMADHGFVGHVSPSTGAPKNRLDAAGIGFRTVLENVAAASTPEEAIDGFLSSPGHRKNLLSNQVNRAGMGAAEKNGRWYFVQLFIF